MRGDGGRSLPSRTASRRRHRFRGASALTIPILAILAGTDAKGAKTRIEALEGLVTDDGVGLARDARRAGLAPWLALDAAPTGRTRAPTARRESGPAERRRA